jgi:hypothetical protein
MSERRDDGLLEMHGWEMQDDEPLCAICRGLLDDCDCPQCVACGESIDERERADCPCGQPLHNAKACSIQHYDEAHRDDEAPDGEE